MDDIEDECTWLQDLTLTDSCYVQFGEEVVDFSSQYGSERSISYTAGNLAGKPSIYPGYGDFTQACVFRTYGKWWKISPSGVEKYRRTPNDFFSDDYIEVSFEEKVYPTKIEVYEIYNPGCIVKVLACDSTSGTDVDTGKVEWVTLWSGQPTYPKKQSNTFSPPLKKVKFLTNIIRLELCQSLVDYYTELDSIRLHGTKTLKCSDDRVTEDYNKLHNQLYEDLQLTDIVDTTTTDTASNTAECAAIKTTIEICDNYCTFHTLPGEVIQLILEYLDLPALCNLAQTCRLLRDHCYDPLLFTDLNLQPHWTQVRDSTLESLLGRCSLLQRLNLAWCGKGGILTNTALETFLPQCSLSLSTLQLSSCSFVDCTTLKLISTHCPNITDLDIGGCRNVDNVAMLLLLRLNKLRRLNLYRSLVDMHSLIAVLRSCPFLENLNLGSCIRVTSMDDVLIEIGQHCPNIISLDLWQARTLTDIGLRAVAGGCKKLQELDIGWCTQVKSNTDCIILLLQQCRSLKKLYLTANRTVCDTDLLAIAQFSPLMEQIDILGTREVTPMAVLSVLEKCKNLIFFDVSFCGGIQDTHVDDWQKQFPNVNIKKSYQS